MIYMFTLIISSLVAIGGLLPLVGPLNTGDEVKSVEIGIQEFSPRGVSGGVAVPASGGSTTAPTCQIIFADNPVIVGNDTTMTFTYSDSENRPPEQYWLHRCSLVNWTRQECDASNEPTSPLHNQRWENIYGGDGSWGTAPQGGSAKAGSLPIGDYLYRLAVGYRNHHYAGSSVNPNIQPGRCQAILSVEQPGPTLNLKANPTKVKYKESSTLTWTSTNTTNTCTAQQDWSGNKANNNSSGESTGELTQNSSFRLICTGTNGNPIQSTAVVTVENGTGVDIEVDKPYVRKNETVKITWNTGTSDPANCNIKTGSVVIMDPVTAKTGSFNKSIVAETTFTLDCESGGNIDSVTVKVLPEFQET